MADTTRSAGVLIGVLLASDWLPRRAAKKSAKLLDADGAAEFDTACVADGLGLTRHVMPDWYCSSPACWPAAHSLPMLETGLVELWAFAAAGLSDPAEDGGTVTLIPAPGCCCCCCCW